MLPACARIQSAVTVLKVLLALLLKLEINDMSQLNTKLFEAAKLALISKNVTYLLYSVCILDRCLQKMYLKVKVPGAEYSSCAIYFWAETGKSTWRNSPYFSEHTCAIYFHAKGANIYLVFGGHR